MCHVMLRYVMFYYILSHGAGALSWCDSLYTLTTPRDILVGFLHIAGSAKLERSAWVGVRQN